MAKCIELFRDNDSDFLSLTDSLVMRVCEVREVIARGVISPFAAYDYKLDFCISVGVINEILEDSVHGRSEGIIAVRSVEGYMEAIPLDLTDYMLCSPGLVLNSLPPSPPHGLHRIHPIIINNPKSYLNTGYLIIEERDRLPFC